jgi:glutaminyl-peptide cyclotransferase
VSHRGEAAPARASVSRRIVLATALLGSLPALARRRAGAATSPTFDGARALRDVERLVAIGPRPPGSAALARTRAYLTAELRSAGWRVRDVPFTAQTPWGPIVMTNVIAEWPGRGSGILAVAGHYDTKVFEKFRFVGANDGGSSTALLIELGRALAPRLRAETPPSTRWLVFFDGEEAQIQWSATDSLYGSRALAAALRASGDLARLRALVVADMIGDRDLVIPRETQSTAWLTGIVWATARRLGLEQHFPDRTQTVEDDHVPFLDAGVAATVLIDLDYGGPPGRNAYWHTPEDTVDKLSAESLRVVGTVILEALPAIEAELARRAR